MITQTLLLDSMRKLQSFVAVINDYNGQFDLVSGCCVVNAKSIMGIFSLDISQPVCLNIYNEDCAEHLLPALTPYKYNTL